MGTCKEWGCAMHKGVQCTAVCNAPGCAMHQGVCVQCTRVCGAQGCAMHRDVQCTGGFVCNARGCAASGGVRCTRTCGAPGGAVQQDARVQCRGVGNARGCAMHRGGRCTGRCACSVQGCATHGGVQGMRMCLCNAAGCAACRDVRVQCTGVCNEWAVCVCVPVRCMGARCMRVQAPAVQCVCAVHGRAVPPSSVQCPGMCSACVCNARVQGSGACSACVRAQCPRAMHLLLLPGRGRCSHPPCSTPGGSVGAGGPPGSCPPCAPQDDYIRSWEDGQPTDEGSTLPCFYYFFWGGRGDRHGTQTRLFAPQNPVPPPPAALDTTKDPCQKVKCSRHKVCVAQGYQRAMCISRKKLEHRYGAGEEEGSLFFFGGVAAAPLGAS